MFRNLVLMFVLGYLALVGVAVLAEGMVVRSIELLRRSHDHELDVVNASRGAARLIIDLETNERGFLLTGEDAFLEPYDKALAQLPTELVRLRATVGSDATSLALVDELGSLYSRWLHDVGEPTVTARRAAPPGPPSAELVDEHRRVLGKALVDDVRALSQKLRDRTHETTLLAERDETAQRARVRHEVWIATFVFALAALLAALRTLRRLDRDVHRLADDADRMASGEYVRAAREIGSPLLLRIENAMGRATDALASRDAEFRALLTASREIGAASSMAGLLARVQSSIEDILPTARIVLVRFVADDVHRILAASPDLRFEEGTLPLAENSVYRQVRGETHVCVVNDPGALRYAEDQPVLEAGFSAYAVISIFAEDRAFAVVLVALRSRRFEAAQVSFLETLVHQIGYQIQAAELRDSLARTNTELVRATNAKNEFLAMMSHELRTPLNAVVGFSEVLADRKFGELNEKQTRFISNVLESARHLLRLINDLLDLSKIEASDTEVERKVCGPRALALEVVDTVRVLASSRRIRIVIEDAIPPLVMADSVRVKQILFSFLSNAVKFTPPEGEIFVSFSSSTHAVRIGIRDNGPGLSVEEQEKLFKPFPQVERATVGGSALGGTGLGLALARQLAALMHGRVGVRSEPNGGSLFWVELPRGSTPVLGTTSLPQTAPSTAPLALVVDDDPAAREHVELALQAAGYRTTSAATGEGALAAARRLRPQVVTLDVFLPGMDGWDVLRVLSSDSTTRNIPVVVLTNPKARDKALALGASACLAKPVDIDALVDAIPSASAARTQRVLVIDDDAAQGGRVREELVSRGFEVHHAVGASDGLALLKSDARIDLVLVSLHRDNAAPLVETLRADPRTRELPVVLLTHGDGVAQRDDLSHKVQAVLEKGELQPEELAREVTGVVSELARQGRG